MRASADVAVVGASTVGLSVACRLRMHGASVAVFDVSSQGGRARASGSSPQPPSSYRGPRRYG
jgi:flavin-dependent dehydrogenase